MARIGVSWRENARPIDRTEKHRIYYAALQLEKREKEARRGPGKKPRKHSAALEVLHALLFTFHNVRSGMCCPSFSAIARATGLSRRKVAYAIKRYSRPGGPLRILRRLVRLRSGLTSKATNVYSLWCPSALNAHKPIQGVRIPSQTESAWQRFSGLTRGSPVLVPAPLAPSVCWGAPPLPTRA